MAYVTGTAADMSALLTAIRSACTANGWTLSGSVLTKGAVAMRIASGVRTGGGGAPYLEFCGGTGGSGTTLVNGCPHDAEIGGISALALTFPVTYHVSVHTAPDEVYVVVQYNLDRVQFAAWGQSTIPQPGGGAWFAASSHGNRGANASSNEQAGIRLDGLGGHSNCALFARGSPNDSVGGTCEAYVRHGLDSGTWSLGSTALPPPTAWRGGRALLGLLPNAWNSESVLLPIQPVVARASNRWSMVVDCAHARYMRVDNHVPFEIFSIGPDRWMALPWLRKNITTRDGGSAGNAADLHSGTLGWAVRYDGP